MGVVVRMAVPPVGAVCRCPFRRFGAAPVLFRFLLSASQSWPAHRFGNVGFRFGGHAKPERQCLALSCPTLRAHAFRGREMALD